MFVKKVLLAIASSFILFACGGGGGGKSTSFDAKSTRGQIVGVAPTKKWILDKPTGMVKVSGGSFIMGQTDYDFMGNYDAEPKTVTVTSFFIDETEITNSEYLQFVYYTRDSIARTLLAESGVEGFQYIEDQGDTNSPYYEVSTSKGEEKKRLNWDADLSFDTNDYPSVEVAEILESMYIAPEERVNDERFIDWSKLKYNYTWVDTKAAAAAKAKRVDYIKSREVNVYPDTTVWTRDFTYSYNEPMHQEYFWHNAYRDYPVVGVTWWQALAFCAYRTKIFSAYSKSKGKGRGYEFRLPTEAEWEYAARGGLDAASYPWGGPYLTDDRGCYLANFKPKRGNYMEDPKKGNWLYTAKVKSFPPNGFGLFDMSGNVSEWTESPYDNSAVYNSANINPNLTNNREKYSKKVVRGGSWKDVGHFLQVGVRDWESADVATSYIGFRCVQTIPESAKKSGSKGGGRSR